MKYLKKFNEELDTNTYLSASNKLKSKGHLKRAKELSDWAIKSKWMLEIDRMSKYGKFKLIIKGNNKQTMEGDFYLVLIPERDSLLDSIDAFKEDGEGTMSFSIGIIPCDEEVMSEFEKLIPDGDMDNGFYWIGWALINFELTASTIKFTNFEMVPYDYHMGTMSLADRPSAVKFRNLIKKLYSDSNFEYPSGYRDIENFYDIINLIYGSEAGLSSEYGFYPAMVSEFFDKDVTVNDLYTR
jgi:hypothetical protein